MWSALTLFLMLMLYIVALSTTPAGSPPSATALLVFVSGSFGLPALGAILIMIKGARADTARVGMALGGAALLASVITFSGAHAVGLFWR